MAFATKVDAGQLSLCCCSLVALREESHQANQMVSSMFTCCTLALSLTRSLRQLLWNAWRRSDKKFHSSPAQVQLLLPSYILCTVINQHLLLPRQGFTLHAPKGQYTVQCSLSFSLSLSHSLLYSTEPTLCHFPLSYFLSSSLPVHFLQRQRHFTTAATTTLTLSFHHKYFFFLILFFFSFFSSPIDTFLLFLSLLLPHTQTRNLKLSRSRSLSLPPSFYFPPPPPISKIDPKSIPSQKRKKIESKRSRQVCNKFFALSRSAQFFVRSIECSSLCPNVCVLNFSLYRSSFLFPLKREREKEKERERERV